jgi:hypothetical protein
MTSQRPPQPRLIHIGTVLTRTLQTVRRESDGGLTPIIDAWEQAVGEQIALNARPAALKGAVLTLHVSSPPWLHHLQFLKSDLINAINASMGTARISEIRLKIGPLA